MPEDEDKSTESKDQKSRIYQEEKRKSLVQFGKETGCDKFSRKTKGLNRSKRKKLLMFKDLLDSSDFFDLSKRNKIKSISFSYFCSFLVSFSEQLRDLEQSSSST